MAIVIGLVIVILIVAWIELPKWWKQRNCKHESYWETMACHGKCVNCGKDLGFVGTLREDKTKKEV